MSYFRWYDNDAIFMRDFTGMRWIILHLKLIRYGIVPLIFVPRRPIGRGRARCGMRCGMARCGMASWAWGMAWPWLPPNLRRWWRKRGSNGAIRWSLSSPRWATPWGWVTCGAFLTCVISTVEVCTCFSIVVLPIIPQIKALQYFDVAEDELYDPPKKKKKKKKRKWSWQPFKTWNFYKLKYFGCFCTFQNFLYFSENI